MQASENPACLTSVPRDLQIENLKREVEMLRAELEKIKLEVRGAGRGGAWGCAVAPTPHTPDEAPVPTLFLPPQAQRYISQLKGQVDTLEAELEEQRKQKQKALVDNEQLRHELAQLRASQLQGERNQGLREEAESAWAGAMWHSPPGCRLPRWGPLLGARITVPPLPRREGQRHGGALQQAEGKAQ